MKQATVTLWGRYKYKISLEGNETMQQIAFKISLEVHKKENKTKFTDHPRAYNYILECLQRKSCLNYRFNADDSENNEKQLLESANELNSQSEFIKKECPECHAKGMITDEPRGYHLFGACKTCFGHGYIYEHQDYRLGYTFSNILVIDIDGKCRFNLLDVRDFYEKVLNCKFKVFSTKKGYWLFSDKHYPDIKFWIFDHCKVLDPGLQIYNLEIMKSKLLELDGKDGEFKRATPEVIKASGLYRAPKELNFDIAFTFLSIKRERSTIRITKKGKDDKVELINI